MGYKRISWQQVSHKKSKGKEIEEIKEKPISKPRKKKKDNPPQTSDVGIGSEGQ